MASQLTILAGYLLFLVLVVAVLGTVTRRERFVFGAGVVVLMFGLTFLTGTLGAAVALLGILAVVAAALPLLAEPAPST